MNLDLCTLAVSPLTICQFVTPRETPVLGLGRQIHSVGKVCILKGLIEVTRVTSVPTWSQNGSAFTGHSSTRHLHF